VQVENFQVSHGFKTEAYCELYCFGARLGPEHGAVCEKASRLPNKVFCRSRFQVPSLLIDTQRVLRVSGFVIDETFASVLLLVLSTSSGQFPRPTVCGASASPSGALRVLDPLFWFLQKSSSLPWEGWPLALGCPSTHGQNGKTTCI